MKVLVKFIYLLEIIVITVYIEKFKVSNLKKMLKNLMKRRLLKKKNLNQVKDLNLLIMNNDSDIEKLEHKIESLESDSIKFATDFVKLQEILNEKANAEAELEHKYERWEYLNNLAEEIENSKK